MKLKSIIILVCLCSILNIIHAQSNDSTKHVKAFKNVIKLSMTSTLLYGNFPLVEYERVVRRNQSFSVQVGVVTLPLSTAAISNTLQLTSTIKKGGFTTAFDYRFYLAKENKDPAPHGVYIGPYISYYNFKGENNMTIVDNNDVTQLFQLKSKAEVLNIGFQLGYQFKIRKRWTFDCILFGPAISNYKVNMQLGGDGDLTNIDVGETLQEIVQKLASKYPGVESLLNKELVNFKGNSTAWSGGFRYSFHLGFRF